MSETWVGFVLFAVPMAGLMGLSAVQAGLEELASPEALPTLRRHLHWSGAVTLLGSSVAVGAELLNPPTSFNWFYVSVMAFVAIGAPWFWRACLMDLRECEKS